MWDVNIAMFSINSFYILYYQQKTIQYATFKLDFFQTVWPISLFASWIIVAK